MTDGIDSDTRTIAVEIESTEIHVEMMSGGTIPGPPGPQGPAGPPGEGVGDTPLTETLLWDEGIDVTDPGTGYISADSIHFDTTSTLSISRGTASTRLKASWRSAVAGGDQILLVDEYRGSVLDALVSSPPVDHGDWVELSVTPRSNSTSSSPNTGDSMLLMWLPIEPSGDKTYTHVQSTLSDVWEIYHGLGKRPSVVAQDSAGAVIYGTVVYLDNDHLTITFRYTITGRADCN